MEEKTIGQRIAQGRKELNLSQEALGEKMGVSRQAISKWESDAAIPEIDKLIALSRLFGTSVGWLLGVEAAPDPNAPESQAQPISEELLLKIEEILRRTQRPKHFLSTGKKILLGAAVLIAVLGCFCLVRDWQNTRLEVAQLGAQLRNNNEQNASILKQLHALQAQIESPGPTLRFSLAEQSFDLEAMEDGTAQVSYTAVPDTWLPEAQASLSVRKDGAEVLTQAMAWDGVALKSRFLLPFRNGYEYWLVVSFSDGSQEQLEVGTAQARDLASALKLQLQVENFGVDVFDLKRSTLQLRDYEFYVRTPGYTDKIQWAKGELRLYHISARGQRTLADTIELFGEKNMADELGQATSFYEMWLYPSTPFDLPQLSDGDGLELWAFLSTNYREEEPQLITSWSYTNGEFIAARPVETAEP